LLAATLEAQCITRVARPPEHMTGCCLSLPALLARHGPALVALDGGRVKSRRWRHDAGSGWPISSQQSVLFSYNKSTTSNQPAVFFSQNKPALPLPAKLTGRESWLPVLHGYYDRLQRWRYEATTAEVEARRWAINASVPVGGVRRRCPGAHAPCMIVRRLS
jgi:hypothetical protein